MNTILVAAVHPDDETLGCGGTLLKYKASGDRIHWLIITAMIGSDYDEEQKERRAGVIAEVAKAYGFDGVEQLGFPAKKLDTVPMETLVAAISGVIQNIKPNQLFLPHYGDIHSDHRVAFEALYSCSKTFRYPFMKRVLMMETISETEFALPAGGYVFSPNVFTDVTSYFEKKKKIMQLYDEELGIHPYPRSLRHLEALALHRGAMCNSTYAESFVLLKEIC